MRANWILTCLIAPGVLAQDAVSLGELLAVIERQEQAAEAFEIEAFSAMTKGPRQHPERAGECNVRVSFEARPWPRFTASLDPQILLWTDKDSFVAIHREVGFNGRWSWNWQRSMTVEGEDTVQVDSAAVSARRSRQWHEVAEVSGWYATVPGFFSTKGFSLSESITEEGSSVWSCVRGPAGELVTKRVRGDTTETWTLVPRWGFAIESYAKVDEGLVRQTLAVTECRRVLDGLWYPVELEWTSRTGRGAQAETHCRAVSVSSVRACDASSLAAGPVFARGTAVRDEVSGATFRVAGDGMALAEIVAAQGADVRAAWAAALDDRGPGLLPWVIAGAAASACLAWFFARRGRRRQTAERRRRRLETASGALVVVAFAPALAGQDTLLSPWATDTTHGQYVDNCALNATLLALVAFDRPADAAAVAHALDLGNAHERVASLGAMQELLEHHALRVRSGRVAGFATLAELLSRGRRLAVVHTKSEKGVGHFFVIACSPEGFLVTNPGWWSRRMSLDDPWLRLWESRLSGLVLLVDEPEAAGDRPAVEPAAGRDDRQEDDRNEIVFQLGQADGLSLDVGSLGPKDEHEWTVRVVNDLGFPIEGIEVETTCGCIREPRLEPTALRPGESARLTFVMDGARTSSGVVREFVLLQMTRAGTTQRVDRHVAVSGTRSDGREANRYVGLLPSVVLGKSDEQRHEHVVTTFMPAGATIEVYETTPDVDVAQGPIRVAGIRKGLIAIDWRVTWAERDGWVRWRVDSPMGEAENLLLQLRPGR